ncbi:Bifunctional protein GlmU [Trichinella pseudospiralis]
MRQNDLLLLHGTEKVSFTDFRIPVSLELYKVRSKNAASLETELLRIAKFSTVLCYINVNFIKLTVTVSFKSAVDVLITALQLVLLKIISSGNNAFIGVVHSFDSESRSFVLISDCHHSRGSICVQIVYGYNIESLEILNHVLTSHDKKLLERFSQKVATSARLP